MLNKAQQINKVIEIDGSYDVMTKRLAGRKLHLSSGRAYHDDYNPSKIKELDDYTNEPLEHISSPYQKERGEIYEKVSQPIIEYYRKRDSFFKVQGDQGINSVYREIKKILNNEIQLK